MYISLLWLEWNNVSSKRRKKLKNIFCAFWGFSVGIIGNIFEHLENIHLIYSWHLYLQSIYSGNVFFI